jgi:hypothetical protein
MEATMATVAPPRRAKLRHVGAWGIVGVRPAVVVAVVLAMLFGQALSLHQHRVTGFIVFGRHFAPYVHPPSARDAYTPSGYDGQFFWLLARDPLLRGEAARGLHALGEEFRAQRIAYPFLARVAAGGRLSAVPYTLLLLNVAAILAATVAAARLAARFSHSELWGIVVGLAPGLVLATLRDLSDTLAVTAMLGGLIAWRLNRRATAAACLTVAVLGREPMMVAVAAIALEGAFRAGRPWPPRRWARKIGSAMWPVVAVPLLAFAAWEAYATWRFGGVVPATTTPGDQFRIFGPLTAFHDAGQHPLNAAIWERAYLVVMVAAAGTAVWRVWSRRTAAAFAAAGFGLLDLIYYTPDRWSYTRYSAPLFLALAVSVLEERHSARRFLWPAIAGVALTAVYPFALLI